MGDETKTTSSESGYDGSHAGAYAELATHLTEPFARDLLHAVAPLIERETTARVLDVGCGGGAFALAYLACYPRGRPGQTVVSTDASEAMVATARTAIQRRLSCFTAPCATAFEFAVADAVNLAAVETGSVQVVVSAFAVNNIENQQEAFQSFRRVLTDHDDVPTIVAATSWIKLPIGMSGFGFELEKIGQLAASAISPEDDFSKEGCELSDDDNDSKKDHVSAPWTQWNDAEKLKGLMNLFGMSDICVKHSVHSLCVGDRHALWRAIVHGCLMMDLGQYNEEEIAAMKDRFFEFIGEQQDSKSVFFVAAAHMMTALF